MLKGLTQHLFLVLRLNYRSWKPIVYGYLVPVLFLIGFASVFQYGHPRLLGQMGQILTITVLGSTCLGMATALVSERERGLWRSLQLLPVSTHWLLLNVIFVRAVIVLLAVLLQLVLAKLLYGTPFPFHPMWGFGFLMLSVFSFLGIGIIVTAVARDVPSVQAIGQCIFLPMILIGGVGIPLYSLPEWAQYVSAFMPGRYSVELLQLCYQNNDIPFQEMAFPVFALLSIGVFAMVAGFQLLRWDNDNHSKLSLKSMLWIAYSLVAWVGVGIAANHPDLLSPATAKATPTSKAMSKQTSIVESIDFEHLPEDFGVYTPLSSPLENVRLSHRMEHEFYPRLQKWKPARHVDPKQAVLNLLSVAANADVIQDRSEAIIARMVFDQMQSVLPSEDLKEALIHVIQYPDSGQVLTSIPELGLSVRIHGEIIRDRSNWYARKFLGRLLGKIKEE